MRLRLFLLIAFVAILASACGLMGAAPTPTAAPQQLSDRSLQVAAEGAVKEYATRNSYEAGVPSFTLVEGDDKKAVVHAIVPFKTLKGTPPIDYDALINLRNDGAGWQAEIVKTFSELKWDQVFTTGPATMKSGAGFSVQVPAGFIAFAAPDSELKPVNLCGTGNDPISAVPLLIVMPGRYSAENVPIILQAYQQCPKQPGLSTILQRLESLRSSDKSLTFERLEMTQIGGQPALIAVVKDANGSMLYDVYVMNRDRQLEFVVQIKSGQDASKILDVLNSLKFN